MCLILVSYETHAPYRLVVAANRDEFHARPTRSAHWWDEAPDLLAGRDLESGGTWMGVTRSGRFAAVTNYSERLEPPEDVRSRGEIVTGFLGSDASTESFLNGLSSDESRYRGFSLLAFDGSGLGFVSNRAPGVLVLEPGLYGLANALLDSNWPKVERGRRGLSEILSRPARVEDHVSALLELLADEQHIASLDPPHSDGVEDSRQRFSPIFIRYPTYGTRASTVLLLARDGSATFAEREWDASGRPLDLRTFRLQREDRQ